MVSSSFKFTPTLDLDTGDGTNYKTFINEILGKFSEIDDAPGIRRTPTEDELFGKKLVFAVRLIHEKDEFDIMIRKRDLYLIGYKGKSKQWSLLNAKATANKVAEFVKKRYQEGVLGEEPFQESSSRKELFQKMWYGIWFGTWEAKQGSLDTAYDELFSKYITGFSDNVAKKVDKEVIRTSNNINKQIKDIETTKEELKKELGDKKTRLTIVANVLKASKTLTEVEEKLKKVDQRKEQQQMQLNLVKRAKILVTNDIKIEMVKEELKRLRLNKCALRSAVSCLNDEKSTNKEKSIIILIQMICEAARIKLIAEHIGNNYLKKKDTERLTDDMIDLQYMWTRGSQIITKGEGCEEFSLQKNIALNREQAMAKFSCIRGILLRKPDKKKEDEEEEEKSDDDAYYFEVL